MNPLIIETDDDYLVSMDCLRKLRGCKYIYSGVDVNNEVVIVVCEREDIEACKVYFKDEIEAGYFVVYEGTEKKN